MNDDDVKELDGDQEALDSLLSLGSPLAESNEYSNLYRYLGTSSVNLPSNFPHQVLQRILVVKIERARSTATLQAGIIGFLTLIIGALLVTVSSRYVGVENLIQLSVIKSYLLPGVATFALLVLVMLDSSRALKDQWRRQS